MDAKTCRKCGISKPTADFYRQKTSSDGLGSYCKECQSEYGKVWRASNPGHKYGLSNADYEVLFQRQGGKCALCKETARLEVDHDHETGRVRGLLCHSCNVSIERVCKIFLGEARAYLDGAYGLPG
jgi:hypothetical protein